MKGKRYSTEDKIRMLREADTSRIAALLKQEGWRVGKRQPSWRKSAVIRRKP
jgi:hypothetical protein